MKPGQHGGRRRRSAVRSSRPVAEHRRNPFGLAVVEYGCRLERLAAATATGRARRAGPWSEAPWDTARLPGRSVLRDPEDDI
jgi:hypothetical protein